MELGAQKRKNPQECSYIAFALLPSNIVFVLFLFRAPSSALENKRRNPGILMVWKTSSWPGPRHSIIHFAFAGSELMAHWLFKEEPGTYSFANLERDGSTIWSGVTNALAQKHLRTIKKGDKVLFYHTGGEKAVVGVMEVTADPTPDPDDPAGKRVVVAVKPVRKLKKPVTLAAIKEDKAFAQWELVRIGRLSVMPVPDELWKKIEAMGK
jgi:predicted RNA-binding protein with PUA-like domain